MWHGRLRRFPVLLPADVLDPDACTAGTLAEYCAADDAALDEYAWLRYECDDTRDVFDEVPDARVLVRWFATSALPSSTTLPLTTTQLASPVPVGEYDIVVTALLDAAHARISVQIACAPGVVDAGTSARRIAEVLRDSGIRVADGAGYDLAALRPAHADELVPLAPHERRRVEQRFGAVRDVLPTTPLQEGLLFHLQLAEDQGVADLYASQSHVTLRGPVDPRRFSRAIGALFERHPNLTAGFVTVGDRSLQIVPARCPIPLTVVRAEEDVAVAEVLREQRAQPFSAASPPLVRFALVESARDEWTLAVTFEHILVDGWSHSLMIGELLELYTDPDAAAPSGRATFRDYCAWLLERDRDAAEGAWVRYLSGIDEPTFLRPDASGAGPRPEFARDHRRDLDSVLSDAVRTTARTAGVTIGTVLHYAWGATLAKLTGRGDVVFGTTVSGRPPEIETSDAIVGLLFNTVPVRVTVSPRDTFADGLRAHQQRQIDVLDAPFVSLSAIQNRIAIPALFDTLFIVQNHPVSVPDATYGADGEVTARRGRLDDSTHYPVSFAVDPVGDMHVRCAYRGDLFGEDDIVALTDRFVATLRALAEQPEALAGRHSITTTHERELVLGEWNATAHDIPCETVADLLEARIARVPDEIALVSAHRRMTFAELGADVDALAGTLADMDVGPESRVALMLPRDERMVVAMFAVFARGAAYVPIDGEHPTERVAYMLETSDATVVLTAAPYRDVVDDAVRTGGRGAQVLDLDLGNGARQQGSRRADGAVFTSRARPHLDNLAYIIFTSGSTGKPKGVAVGYRGLTNMYYNHVAEIFDPVVAHQGGRRMRIAHTTSFSFDASWEQLFWLLAGHEVHVVDETLRKEPTELLARYDTERIDGFDVTPSYGQILVEHGLLERDRPRGRSTSSDAAGVVFVSLGGEAVPEQLWTGLRDAPGVLGYNLYGPTEYTINALGADLADRATSNVGRPIFNTRAYVLDDAMTPVPPGVPGELYLAGAGIARGYVGRAALTCDRFVACPWGVGERMYRTGDLVRHSADGSLDYLGRSDDQVKIRGFRVEPGEISDCLAGDPSVGRAVTIVRGDGAKARLLSYVVAADGAAPDVVALARRAADALPDYMVPSGIAVVEDIPLTVNGKTDARALPDIATADTESVAPVGEAEHAVAAVACALLGLDEISVTANLFDAGANSLMAMRLAARVAEDGIVPDLRVRDVFAGPTVRDIAARAGDDGQSGNAADPVLIELAPSRERTLFCFHASSGFGTVYASLVPFVADGTGVVGVQDPVHAGDSHDPAGYREVVERYTAAVVAASGDGPIELLGWSYGGHLAYAVAADLERAGRQVASLTIVDALPIPAGEAAHWTLDQLEADAYRQVLRYAGIDSAADTPGTPEELAETITQSGSALAALGRDGVAATLDACMRCNRMMLEPTAGTVSAPTALVTSPARVGDGLADRWRVHCPDLREVVETDVHHYRLLDRDAVDGWAGPVMRFVDESYGESARRVEESNR
nr:non-ribosomal peptide synthetase [Rhodococcus sp. HNM0569]